MKLQYLKNAATLKLDTEKCVGCGMCVEVCPHQVFAIHEGKAEVIRLDACMECGACLKNCAYSAISVSPGVGCASAILKGMLTGSEPTCDCSDGECC